jgi:hypothetical protein
MLAEYRPQPSRIQVRPQAGRTDRENTGHSQAKFRQQPDSRQVTARQNTGHSQPEYRPQSGRIQATVSQIQATAKQTTYKPPI